MFGAEFFVLIGFIVFLCLLGYVGAHRMLLGALDKRGQAIADELGEAAKLRAEATALLEGFEKKKLEAEANAAAIVAEARAQAEVLAKEAAERMADFVARRAKQAEAKIALAEVAGRSRGALRRRRLRRQGGRNRAAPGDPGRGGSRARGARNRRAQRPPELTPEAPQDLDPRRSRSHAGASFRLFASRP